ncbi:MAG: tRNA (adenosine(37)-N6)-threonylcarbamoyltransferase complex dimerization subunit type 1 TsaB [Pseudomonadota bacterium]|nr:tRNA (adenosine(37)-N6)-threonylcarbamoyltransferase complex dimerization subunit type 1 TsaB [Pseudomonadota bacterium]
MKNKKILTLAIDTVADSISVALIQNGQTIASQYRAMERGQGEALIPMIQNVIRKAQYDFNDLTQVAVSVGPGSFTGVRIGLATARGIGLALNIPVVGISAFEAAAFKTHGDILIVLDTKRGDFFTQRFQDEKPVEAPCIRDTAAIKSLNPNSIGGSGKDMLSFMNIPIVQSSFIPAVAVGLCAMTSSGKAEPFYLRDADVSI